MAKWPQTTFPYLIHIKLSCARARTPRKAKEPNFPLVKNQMLWVTSSTYFMTKLHQEYLGFPHCTKFQCFVHFLYEHLYIRVALRERRLYTKGGPNQKSPFTSMCIKKFNHIKKLDKWRIAIFRLPPIQSSELLTHIAPSSNIESPCPFDR